MARAGLELADVFRRFLDSYRKTHAMTPGQRRVAQAILSCRTAALGGHVERCTSCPYTAISYNSCRNRHCPKCQGQTRLAWLSAREAELLAVSYFHVVFTVPKAISELALFNKKLVYGLIFKTAAQALLEIGGDEKHLGARLGFLGVLHTWDRTLRHHAHIHFVVPGGGLSLDGQRWISVRKRKKEFLLSVRVLSRRFRTLLLSHLDAAFRTGELALPGALSALSEPVVFAAFLQRLRATNWVVFSKHPFGGPRQVLRYLGRYTHRVAIGNERLLRMDEDSVTFRYQDNRDGRHKVMTLPGEEFIRRFLHHVLPRGFHRIRHFGFLANRTRKKAVDTCRRLIAEQKAAVPDVAVMSPLPVLESRPPNPACPACGVGRLLRTELPAVPILKSAAPPILARASPEAA